MEGHYTRKGDPDDSNSNTTCEEASGDGESARGMVREARGTVRKTNRCCSVPLLYLKRQIQ